MQIEYELPWWLSGKEPAGQCRRRGFHLWVGKMPWRRTWQPTPVFSPGKPHGACWVSVHRVIIASDTRDSLLFSRFLNSGTHDQGAFPWGLSFQLLFLVSSTLPSVSVWSLISSISLSCFLAASGASCLLWGYDMAPAALPQTLPPEAA